MPLLKQAVASGHANGMKVKIYYTTRELTNNLPELFAFWSLDGEIICPSPGKDGIKARPLTNGSGPHPWLVEHLGETGFIPAWREVLARPLPGPARPCRHHHARLAARQLLLRRPGVHPARDRASTACTLTTPRSGRKAFQRAHRIFEAAGKPLLADMHSWNHWNPTAGSTPSAYCLPAELPVLPSPLVRRRLQLQHRRPTTCSSNMSGIPFGLMSEMLDDPNPWHGMVFGMTTRLGWSGDPRPLWKFWDEFGMARHRDARLVEPGLPGQDGQPQGARHRLPEIRQEPHRPRQLGARKDQGETRRGLAGARTRSEEDHALGTGHRSFQPEAVFAADGQHPGRTGPGLAPGSRRNAARSHRRPGGATRSAKGFSSESGRSDTLRHQCARPTPSAPKTFLGRLAPRWSQRTSIRCTTKANRGVSVWRSAGPTASTSRSTPAPTDAGACATTARKDLAAVTSKARRHRGHQARRQSPCNFSPNSDGERSWDLDRPVSARRPSRRACHRPHRQDRHDLECTRSRRPRPHPPLPGRLGEVLLISFRKQLQLVPESVARLTVGRIEAAVP